MKRKSRTWIGIVICVAILAVLAVCLLRPKSDNGSASKNEPGNDTSVESSLPELGEDETEMIPFVVNDSEIRSEPTSEAEDSVETTVASSAEAVSEGNGSETPAANPPAEWTSPSNTGENETEPVPLIEPEPAEEEPTPHPEESSEAETDSGNELPKVPYR